MLKLYLLILLSNTKPEDKFLTIWHLSKCEEVSITCAIVRFETGHLQCRKRKAICSLDYNNLFGFRYKGDYLKFKNYHQSVIYYKRWQHRHWHKYKKRHPKKNYYDFLKWVGYCNSMDNYIRTIKKIEKQ